MKRKLNPIEKYKPMWEGGKSVEQYNIKVGFKIRMYVVNELNALRQKDPNAFGPTETEELTKMIMDLKQDKGTISAEDQNCSIEDYQAFLSDFFTKVDYEDRHGTVTMKTISKFRLMASFIDVLATWEPIDDEMIKCKKYCQYKAVDIFKSLKKGEVPKRGGPKEQEQQGETGLGNEIDELSKGVDNMGMGFNNNQNNNNPYGNNDPYGGGYGGGNQFGQQPPNNNPYGQQNNNNPYGQQQPNNNPYGQPQNQQNNNNQGGFSNPFSNPFGNNNNNNNANNNNNFNNNNNNYGGYNQQPQQQQYQQPQPQQQYQPPQQQRNNFNNKQMNSARASKVLQSKDKNPNKRCFKGKYELNCAIPVKYQTVDYYMLVENVRLNNENALRNLKRGEAKDILNTVLDSLEFLSYIHK